jgi:hypothetical protein
VEFAPVKEGVPGRVLTTRVFVQPEGMPFMVK